MNRVPSNYFTQYVDDHFTAHLEDQLDAISRGEEHWIPVLDQFWSPFKDRMDDTPENVSRKDVTQEEIDENCPQCDKVLSIRLGRRGRFVGCTGYPECDYTRNLEGDAESLKWLNAAIAQSANRSSSLERGATANSSAAVGTPIASTWNR